jgi:probable phosphoglycerate mutase
MEMNIKKKSASAKLIAVRHGQDLDNARNLINGRRDAPLTELGIQQALNVTEELRSREIDLVYTSPLKRAGQTAAIISERLSISELRIDAELIERDYGILTGRPASDISAIAKKTYMSKGFQYVIEADGAEGYPQLWTRAGNVLQRIRNRHSGQTVLIVAHNEIIKMMRANSRNRSWEEELVLPPLAFCEVIALEP